MRNIEKTIKKNRKKVNIYILKKVTFTKNSFNCKI